MFEETANGQTQYCEECYKKQNELDAKENIINHLADHNIELRKCYEENLKLCKWQEQQINKLATAIEKIDKLNKAQDLNQGSRCIEIGKVIKEITKC